MGGFPMFFLPKHQGMEDQGGPSFRQWRKTATRYLNKIGSSLRKVISSWRPRTIVQMCLQIGGKKVYTKGVFSSENASASTGQKRGLVYTKKLVFKRKEGKYIYTKEPPSCFSGTPSCSIGVQILASYPKVEEIGERACASVFFLWKLASVLDSWALKPCCNFLRFPAMCPPPKAAVISAGKCIFLQENAFFCMKVHFR